VNSPSGVQGGAPAAIAFSAYFRPQNASGSKKKYDSVAQSIRKNWYFYMKRVNPLLKVMMTVTTTFKSGSDKSPSSHTKLRLWEHQSAMRLYDALVGGSHSSQSLLTGAHADNFSDMTRGKVEYLRKYLQKSWFYWCKSL